MRKILMLAAALVACSKAEKPATDTAAVASAPAMAPAPTPAPLTAAQVAGTWHGMIMGETGDSVTARYTTVSADGLSGTLTREGTKIAIPFTATYNADSMIVSSNAPYASPDPKVPKMNFRAVGRMKDGKLVGTSINTLGSKPDSVVARGRWSQTKAP